jgi:hypothetical protein
MWDIGPEHATRTLNRWGTRGAQEGHKKTSAGLCVCVCVCVRVFGLTTLGGLGVIPSLCAHARNFGAKLIDLVSGHKRLVRLKVCLASIMDSPRPVPDVVPEEPWDIIEQNGIVLRWKLLVWDIIEQNGVVLRWKLLVRKNRRLGFKRRCWSFLGQLLKDIKQRGRSV